MSTWQERHKEACEKAEPPEHAWFQFQERDTFLSCARCGICKRSDGKPQRPCPGVVKISLRRNE